MASLVDHLLILIFAGLFPIYGLWSFRTLVRRVEAGDRAALRRGYWETMAWLWGFALAVLAYWLNRDRSFSELGLSTTIGLGFWAGLSFVVVVALVLILQWRRVVRDDAYRDAARNAFGSVGALMPRTRAELSHFAAVSVTAGICEELLFRGYLIWHIAQFLGMWPAAIISSLLFGYGHVYQGISGVGKTAAVGFVGACLYLFTGSLWVPILLHATIDLIQGATAYAALGDDRTSAQAVTA